VHEERVRIKSRDRGVPTGVIHLQAQWIFSEVSFCKQAIETLDQAIQYNRVQTQNLRQHLLEYREPFKQIFGENVDYASEIEEEQEFID